MLADTALLGTSPQLVPLPDTTPVIVMRILDAELTGVRPPCYDTRTKAKVHINGFKKFTTARAGGEMYWDEVIELETSIDLHRVFRVSVQTARLTRTLAMAAIPLRSLELLARKHEGIAEYAFSLKDEEGEKVVGKLRCELSIREPEKPKRRKSIFDHINEQSHKISEGDGFCSRLARCFRPKKLPAMTKRMSDEEVLKMVRQLQ